MRIAMNLRPTADTKVFTLPNYLGAMDNVSDPIDSSENGLPAGCDCRGSMPGRFWNDLAEPLPVIIAENGRLRRQFRQAERMAGIGSWRLTLADQYVEWSDGVYAIHDMTPGNGEALADALSFYPVHDRHKLEQALERTRNTGEAYDIELDFISATGRTKRVRAIGELELADGVPVALTGVFQDVTDRHALLKAVEAQAYTDDLTRVASRARFNAVIEEEIAKARLDRASLALVMIDLDHFKQANDLCGHAAGDKVLRRAAKRLQADWLNDSFAARLGGDEFVLLITDQDLIGNLADVLQRLLADLRQTVESPGYESEIVVTATLGACHMHPEDLDRSILLERADRALYGAKARQRGSALIAGDIDVITAAEAVFQNSGFPSNRARSA